MENLLFLMTYLKIFQMEMKKSPTLLLLLLLISVIKEAELEAMTEKQ